ncbi:MAG: hypothetical protein GEV28_07665 [Actinophytocola sp.]|uniref:hypothetical protein n=1 Tax=Actinophytocola sp. TaxID=1872138 RepID=UPI00132360E9|nr:hypothetical protein [Actinophytocola sp.]MPZ80267.1 hypothetical protein [Actinophytocola sp.]
MSEVFVTLVSVGVDAGCPMRFRVHDKDIVEFWAGGDPIGEFDVSFEVEALRQFLELGARAIAEVDELRAREQADADPKCPEAKAHVA